MSILNAWRSAAPHFLSISRIIVAFLFIPAGTAKLYAFPAAVMPGGGTVEPFTLIGVAALLEAFGGLLLLLGVFTRPVAFILSGEMAFAYFIGHAPGGFWPLLNHGTEAVLFCFYFLYVSSAGGGPLSIDTLLSRIPVIARLATR
jgi:putative oxidoreductase